uniref:Immunoglobulin V-set domain-containing protein n=1 Tax=Erpetoichthys calabaricus TaxID=27687 RepID=A0A8C4SRK5_ERPCA
MGIETMKILISYFFIGKSKAHDTVIEKKGNSAVLPSNFTYEPLAKGEKVNIIWLKNNHYVKTAEIMLNCSANTRTCSKNKDNRFQLIGNVFDQNGSVLLKDLQLSDTGPYYYRLEFPDSMSKSWTYTEPTNLTVQGSAEIVSLDVVYWFFRPIKVVCLAEGNPLPSLTLNFNLAQTGQGYQAENLTIHEENEFQIRGEIQNPTGLQYICNATNKVGTQHETVYVGIPPLVFITLSVFIFIFLLL